MVQPTTGILLILIFLISFNFSNGSIFTNPVVKNFYLGTTLIPSPSYVSISPKVLGQPRNFVSQNGDSFSSFSSQGLTNDNASLIGVPLQTTMFVQKMSAGRPNCMTVLTSSTLAIVSGAVASLGGITPASSDVVWTAFRGQETIIAVFSNNNNQAGTAFTLEISELYGTSSFYTDSRESITGTGNGVYFIAYDGDQSLVVVSRSNTMWLVGILSHSITTTFSAVSYTRQALVIDSETIYVCGIYQSQLVIEVALFPISQTQIITVSGSVPSSLTNCLSIEIDSAKGQLFMVVTDSSNNYLVSATISGGSSQYIQITNTVLGSKGFSSSGINYPLFISESETERYVYALGGTSNNTVLLGFETASLCPSDCSGLGSCYQNVCTCEEGHILDDCSGFPPVITGISKLNFQTSNQVTISGNNFFNTSDYSITIADASCDDMLFINETTVECTLPPITGFNPLTLLNSTIEFEGYPSEVYTSTLFIQPTLTSISQYSQNGTVYLEGLNFYTNTYTIIKIGETKTIDQYCDVISSTVIQCQYSPNITSGQFNLQGTNFEVFGSITYQVLPWISTVIPNEITTQSMNITIQGQSFLASSNVHVQQGDSTPVSPSLIISDTQLVVASLNYYSNVLKVFLNDNETYLNTISINYIPPESTGTSVNQTNNQFTITGTNFPGVESEISTDPDCQIISQNITSITWTLPNYFTNTDLFEIIIYGEETNGFNINLEARITSMVPIPPLSGGIVTISGRYLLGDENYIQMETDEIHRLECESLDESDNFPVAKLECTIPAGTGKFNLLANTVFDEDTTVTDSIETNYANPTIESISPTSYIKGKNTEFTITGDNFANVSATVLINHEQCNITEITVSQIICNITSDIDPSTVENPVLVQMEIDTLPGQNDQILIYEKSCPSDCSNQGKCDVSTGICGCNSGLHGNDCSILDSISQASKPLFNQSPLLLFIIQSIVLISLFIQF